MRTNYFALILGSIALTMASSAWSLPTENTLDPSYYDITHTPRIDFTQAALTYKKGKLKAKSNQDFTLITPDGAEAIFLTDTKFKLKARINSDGELVNGKFIFTSKDSMFGKGKTTVFSGLLTDIGWNEATGLLEFQIGSFSGWACDMGWCTESERLWFSVGGELGGIASAIGSRGEWEADGISGVAVIPVPAAVWLFGSGLLALAGFTRKNKA